MGREGRFGFGVVSVVCFRIRVLTGMQSSASTPFFGGRGESFAIYAQHVQLGRQVTILEPAKRASAIIMKMDTVARENCIAVGGGAIIGHEGAANSMELLRDFLPWGAADSVCAILLRGESYACREPRAAQTMDKFLARYDLLRRKAQSGMQMGRFRV